MNQEHKPDRKVDALVAYIAVDPETGLEGIMAAQIPDTGIFAPLVMTAGAKAFEKARGFAISSAKEYGMKLKIKRFEQVSEEWVIE